MASSTLLQILNTNFGVVQSVVTLVLVVITGFYAWWTRSMAKTLLKQIELEARPYAGLDLHIDIISQGDSSLPNGIALETDWIQLKYKIINLGKVPIVYKVTKSSFNTVNNTPKQVTGPVLYPTQGMFHTTEVFKIPKTEFVHLKGHAEIKIIYWALGIPEKKYFHSRIYDVTASSSQYFVLEDRAGQVE